MVRFKEKSKGENSPLLGEDTLSPCSIAAYIVDEAMRGRTARSIPRTNAQLKQYRILRKFRLISEVVVVALVFISFIETPQWCVEEGTFSFATPILVQPHQVCSIPEAPPTATSELAALETRLSVLEENTLLFATSYVASTQWVLVAEFICSGFLMSKHLLEWSICGWDILISRHGHQFVLNNVYMADILIASINSLTPMALFPPSFRLATLLRGMLVVAHRSLLQQSLGNIWSQFRAIIPITSMPLAACSFFGVAMGILYRNAPGDEFFTSLSQSTYTMFSLMTTQDYPQRLQAIYRHNRSSAIWLNLFLFISTVVVANLILALVYTRYTEHRAYSTKLFYIKKYKTIDMAFEALMGEREIATQEEVMQLVMEMKKYGYDIHLGFLMSYMKQLDIDGNGMIDKHEFRSICNVLQCKISSGLKKDSWVENKFPKLYRSAPIQHLEKFVLGPAFKLVGLGVVLFSTLLTVIEYESPAFAKPLVEIMEHTMLDELVIVLYFVFEVLAMLTVYAWSDYWKSLSNRWDFFVTWAFVIIMADTLLFSEGVADKKDSQAMSNTQAISVMVILRTIRLIEMFEHIPALREILRVLHVALPALYKPIATFLACLYFFCCVGVGLYGGLVHKGAPNYGPGDDDDVFNMNDFGGATVMFLVQCIEGWVTAFVWKFSELRWWGPYVTLPFFLLFWVVMILVVFNVFTALLIDTFMTLGAKMKEELRRKATEDDPTAEEWRVLQSRTLQLGYQAHLAKARGDAEEAVRIRKELGDRMDNLRAEKTINAFKAFKRSNLKVTKFIDMDAEMFLKTDVDDDEETSAFVVTARGYVPAVIYRPSIIAATAKRELERDKIVNNS